MFYGPCLHIKVNGKLKPIYRVCKGDDVDGHFYWRPLNNHYATREEDCDEGGETSVDVRELAFRLGLTAERSFFGLPNLEHKDVLQKAADAGLLLFLSTKFPEPEDERDPWEKEP